MADFVIIEGDAPTVVVREAATQTVMLPDESTVVVPGDPSVEVVQVALTGPGGGGSDPALGARVTALDGGEPSPAYTETVTGVMAADGVLFIAEPMYSVYAELEEFPFGLAKLPGDISRYGSFFPSSSEVFGGHEGTFSFLDLLGNGYNEIKHTISLPTENNFGLELPGDVSGFVVSFDDEELVGQSIDFEISTPAVARTGGRVAELNSNLTDLSALLNTTREEASVNNQSFLDAIAGLPSAERVTKIDGNPREAYGYGSQQLSGTPQSANVSFSFNLDMGGANEAVRDTHFGFGFYTETTGDPNGPSDPPLNGHIKVTYMLAGEVAAVKEVLPPFRGPYYGLAYDQTGGYDHSEETLLDYAGLADSVLVEASADNLLYEQGASSHSVIRSESKFDAYVKKTDFRAAQVFTVGIDEGWDFVAPWRTAPGTDDSVKVVVRDTEVTFIVDAKYDMPATPSARGVLDPIFTMPDWLNLGPRAYQATATMTVEQKEINPNTYCPVTYSGFTTANITSVHPDEPDSTVTVGGGPMIAPLFGVLTTIESAAALVVDVINPTDTTWVSATFIATVPRLLETESPN